MLNIHIYIDGQEAVMKEKRLLVSDSRNYLQAIFSFSSDWDDMSKTAIFTRNGEIYPVLLSDDRCIIPWEVLKPGGFVCSVVGMLGGTVITSSLMEPDVRSKPVPVMVYHSGYVKNETIEPPTPDIYEQIINAIAKAQNTAQDALGESIINITMDEDNQVIVTTRSGDVYNLGILSPKGDYVWLINKPSINGIMLEGDMKDEDILQFITSDDIEDVIYGITREENGRIIIDKESLYYLWTKIGALVAQAEYEHPQYPEQKMGLYKLCVDQTGHVKDVQPVSSEDITNLGISSGSGDVTYVYNQQTASAVWNVVHGLNKNPNVTVVDSAGSVVQGDCLYIDANQVQLKFSAPFSGKAYLN